MRSPVAEQQRLARQLAFYDHLILMLARYHLVRPSCLTPLEFVESLLFLPSDVYDTINRLTMLFYRVRYGGAELSIGQRKRLETVLGQLSTSLRRCRWRRRYAVFCSTLGFTFVCDRRSGERDGIMLESANHREDLPCQQTNPRVLSMSSPLLGMTSLTNKCGRP